MELLSQLTTYVFLVIAGLLPIANPFSTAPVFLGMTSGSTNTARNRLALRASIYMAGLLLVFLFAGAMLLGFFGITIPGLRIAGGIIIILVGIRMLFPHPAEASEAVTAVNEENLNRMAFTPLAMPLLSGPGSIGVVLSMSDKIASVDEPVHRLYGYIVVAIGIVLTAAICWLVLRSSTKITRFLGDSGIDAMTRIMAFFLIAIGVEFILGGVKGFIQTL